MDLNVQNMIGMLLAIGSILLGVLVARLVVGPEKWQEVEDAFNGKH